MHIKVRINKVMILMGSELIEVETAHPGNIVALSISTSQSDIAPNKEDYVSLKAYKDAIGDYLGPRRYYMPR